jgi:hypothetical protein
MVVARLTGAKPLWQEKQEDLMADIKLEEVKKELEGMVAKEKQSVMSAEEKKALVEKAQKDQEAQKAAEAQKAKDAGILAKKEEERSQEEKDRAKTLAEQEKKDKEKKAADDEAKLSADEKIKRIQEKSQKRIDEISSDLKVVQDKSSKEAQELRVELKELRQENEDLNKRISAPKTDDLESLIEEQEQGRIAKYLEADKDKPLSKRHEMSDDDLNQWLVDDYAAANRWLVEQSLRRNRERSEDITKERRKTTADEFVKKQKLSMEKVSIRHPELDVAKRVQELKVQGKPEREIADIISKENDKLRILGEIMREPGAEKYLSTEDGPEKAAEEMERRLKGTSNATDKTKIDELTKTVEELSAEVARLTNLDVGVNSTTRRSKESDEKLTEHENTLVDTMKSMNAPQKSIDEALKKFRKDKAK